MRRRQCCRLDWDDTGRMPAVDEVEQHGAAPVTAAQTGVGTLFKGVARWSYKKGLVCMSGGASTQYEPTAEW